jgi:hypothetical protein
MEIKSYMTRGSGASQFTFETYAGPGGSGLSSYSDRAMMRELRSARLA